MRRDASISPARLLDRREKYPLRAAEGGVRRAHMYTASREGGCALHFRKRGAGVSLKGGGWEFECLHALITRLLFGEGYVLTWLPPWNSPTSCVEGVRLILFLKMPLYLSRALSRVVSY